MKARDGQWMRLIDDWCTGALRSRRRGSFLVLVVGTLAMLSIIMIVYVAIGNSDKRTSASLARRNRSEEIVSLFSDYVAQIIADDAVTVAPDDSNKLGATAPGGLLYVREAWDVPSTNWATDSSIWDPTDPKFFRARGVGDDPWLASTTPTWLNYDPQVAAMATADKTFAKRRDWLHITNIAPDGRFVNLYNLWNNFDAKPGTSEASGDFHLNGHLSLTDQSGAVEAMNPWKVAVKSGSAAYENPATFDSWQVGAFRPVKGPFKAGPQDILQTNKPWDYPPYQWADADGDGFFDSRWFEMVDARDTGNGTASTAPQFFRSLLPTDPNYRWFFAARIIDLSSLVNVNTATDGGANPNEPTNASAAAPFKYNVVGLTPADVDLRRLLTMRDATESVSNGSALGTLTIEDVLPNGAVNALKYSGAYSGIHMPLGGNPITQNYNYYGQDLTTSTLQFPGFNLVTKPANDLAWGGYESLRASLNLGRPPGRFSNFKLEPLLSAKNSYTKFVDRNAYYTKAAPGISRPAYRAVSTANGDPAMLNMSPAAGIPATPTGAIDFGIAFKLNNLIELLTYRSVNDPEVTSSLEAALGGQLQSRFATAPTQADIAGPVVNYGPLRDNRSLELERENLAYSTGASAGLPTEAAMLKSYTDLRQYLTTLSGARPIVASSQTITNLDSPPALVVGTDLSTYVPVSPTAATLFPAYATALMPGMALYSPDATTPVEIWKSIKTDSDSKALRGMFYGNQGPLTALLAAGHMAANFASGAEPPSTGSTTRSHAPFVLVLAEEAYDDQPNKLPQDLTKVANMGWKQYFPAWWSDAGRHLNLARDPVKSPATKRSGKAKLTVEVAAPPVPAPAVNIYGSGDPQPFLVETASFTVYRDMPQLIGSEVMLGADAELVQNPPGSTYSLVTINGDVSNKNNSDLMFRVFAVKIHNPFAQPISLSAGSSEFGKTFSTTSGTQFGANSMPDMFYIRAGTGTDADSSFSFVLADVVEEKSGNSYSGSYHVNPVTILPNETILFYALNADARSLAHRFAISNRKSQFDANNAQYFEAWLTTQMGPESKPGFRRLKMLRVDDKFNQKALVTPASSASFEFTRLLPKYDSDQTVMLLRSVRTDSGTLTNDSAAGSPNSIWNDQVCDRLRLGNKIVLDQQLNPGANTAGNVTGMRVSADGTKQDPTGAPTLSDGTPNYNTRVTITLASHARRRGDPLKGADLKPGMLPAWAVDPKDEKALAWYDNETVPVNLAVKPYRLTLNDVLADMNLGKKARYSSQFPYMWEALDALYPTLAQAVTEWTDKIPDNKANKSFGDLRRELSTNGNKYQGYTAGGFAPDGTSQIRPTDLLNVMAIGSTHVPLDASGTELVTGSNPDFTKQWTTTAEAIAIALGYSDRNNFDVTQGNTDYGPLDYYYFDLYATDPTKAKPLFDGGFLKTDDFVAVRYDSSDKAYTTGVGAPIAGNVLSMFRVHPDNYASLSIATPGLVNINTAPQAVLRVLPFTFPSTNELVPAAGPEKASTFWVGAVENERATNALKTDVAAMIESYRDKIAVELRPDAKKGAGNSMPTWFAGFFDRSENLFDSQGKQQAPNTADIGDYTKLPGSYVGGRYWSNGITGIQENAGFRSVGELLAVKHIEFTSSTGAVTTTGDDLAIRTSNIDFLGDRRADKPTNLYGTDNIMEQVATVDATTGAATITDIKPLQFGHTYQDKLKILSGLLGSITVRSDMYAVWFIARGYQRSDCEGLPAGQPMVPTVERRFLMVIDRSNVTRIGQKPRVLAFVEVPL